MASTTQLCGRLRCSDADTLISNIVRHRDLDLRQVLLHFLLHHALHEDPALALKLAVSTVHDTEDALAQCLLHLPHEAADLVDKLGLDVVSKTAVASSGSMAALVELRVEGVPAKDLLEGSLELVGEQLEQLLLDPAEHLAELDAHLSVYLGETRAQVVADNFGESTRTLPIVAIPILDVPRRSFLVMALQISQQTPNSPYQVLDLVLNLPLRALSKIPGARIAAQPALDMVQGDASKLLSNWRVLFLQLPPHLLLYLGTYESGFLVRVA